MAKKQNPLSTPLHGIYIPAGLLIVGAAIIDRTYVPYAVGLALLLSGFKVFRGRKLHLYDNPWRCTTDRM
jgi:cytochrome-b5 reductase